MMTNQQGDQDALNALVDDCYSDGWPWGLHDVFIVETWPGYFGIIWAFVDNKPIGFYVKVAEHPDFVEAPTEFKNGVPVGSMPLAGTWVEGRLIELMGEAFAGLHYHRHPQHPKTWSCVYLIDEKFKSADWHDTPIQALCAALRAVLEAGKEVDGDT